MMHGVVFYLARLATTKLTLQAYNPGRLAALLGSLGYAQALTHCQAAFLLRSYLLAGS
jgi:hypothetical protein